MISKFLNEEDINIIGMLHDPIILSEILFTPQVNNLESLRIFEDDKFFNVRLYEIPMLSYEYMIAYNPDLSEAQNFELKQRVGNTYMYCGRKIGKTLCMLLDLFFDTIHNIYDWVTAFSSLDMVHIKHILEPYIAVMQRHPFFMLFNSHVVRNPNYKITIPTGHTLEGVNMNLKGRNPGAHWERMRANKIVIDEHQYETDVVAQKRSQATSELGAIERFAGITNFTKHSPAGKVFDDLEKSKMLINLPEYISPYWTNARYKEAIEDYDGKESIGFRIHVEAEVCEGASGVYDMKRVKSVYNKSKYVKRFEIKKDDLLFLSDILILEKPKNAEQLYICADFGETAPTEIIIVSKIGDKFKYEHNITLYRLVPDEQFKVFDFLINLLSPTIVAIDGTEEGGKQIYRDLVEKYGKRFQKNIISVEFNKKIAVDFKKNEKGKVEIDPKTGKPILEYEMVRDWSIRQIKKLIYYSDKIELATDSKLHKQLGALKKANLGGRVVYGSTEENHLHQAFQVFGIARFQTEFNINEPIEEKKWGIGALGTLK